MTEINNAGTATGPPVVGSNLFFSSSDEQNLSPVRLTMDHPYLSIATMLAPSPDWFTGISSWNAVSDGTWYDSFSIETYPWDAGTEAGSTYSINGTPESGSIARITTATVPSNGILLNPDGDDVYPVARWECQASAASGDPNDDTSPPGACGLFCQFAQFIQFLIGLFTGN